MSLSNVKLKFELSFQDVESPDADRLRHKVRAAREVKELWMLRSDAHQLISRKISQQEAAKRINALLPCFEQWIPKSSLVKFDIAAPKSKNRPSKERRFFIEGGRPRGT